VLLIYLYRNTYDRRARVWGLSSTLPNYKYAVKTLLNFIFKNKGNIWTYVKTCGVTMLNVQI